MSDDKATKYAKAVVKGDIVACKWVILACKRHLNDLEKADNKGFFYDKKAVKKILGFFKHLRYTKGEWAGQEFIPSPWQVFLLSSIFGWKWTESKHRRYKVAYLETARKSGKTETLAGIGLYLLAADKEAGAEVYSVATKMDQARISHSAATMMVRKSSELRSRVEIFKNNLNIVETGSKFLPLGADSKTMDGLNVHGGMVDELHAHATRDVWDVIITATGARRQSLIMAITTAGYDKNSICWEQHDYTEKVLEGIIVDESHFGIIYTLDEGDDWQDEAVWIKANPNLNVCTKIDDLRAKALKAAEVPTQLNAFLRLHMNIWTESVTRWIGSDKWNACDGEVDEEKLKGRLCYMGLDLSTTTDVSALALVFPPEEEDGVYSVLCRFWIPAENMRDRVRRDRVPYDTWVREGFITATQGNIIDYNSILAQIDADCNVYDVKELAFDRWGSQKIITDLMDLGFENEKARHVDRHLIQFGQGFASMNSPSKELEKLVIGERIAHGGNPVLTWMMSNTVIKMDPAGNIKPDKGESTERIDGIVATIMALDRATRNTDNSSIYEDRGVFVISILLGLIMLLI